MNGRDSELVACVLSQFMDSSAEGTIGRLKRRMRWFSSGFKIALRMVKILITKGGPCGPLSCVVGRSTVRASEAYLCVRLRECVCRGPQHPDSYLVDPASNICLFQRLSHACLRISELIQ